MSLSDEIKLLQNRVLAELASTHEAKLGCPTAMEIERIAEAKAARDVLIHNRGIANKTYREKAGNLARFHAGEKVNIPEQYHRATWELIRKVVSDVTTAALAKVT